MQCTTTGCIIPVNYIQCTNLIQNTKLTDIILYFFTTCKRISLHCTTVQIDYNTGLLCNLIQRFIIYILLKKTFNFYHSSGIHNLNIKTWTIKYRITKNNILIYQYIILYRVIRKIIVVLENTNNIYYNILLIIKNIFLNRSYKTTFIDENFILFHFLR